MGSVHPGIPKKLALDMKCAFGTEEFVETGTYLGETSHWAAGAFRKVVTIEAHAPLFDKAKERFSSTTNIELLSGSSVDLLPVLLPRLGGPALFWLDAHWSGSGTAGGDLECPLLEEINLILSHSAEHILLIDDARLFLAPPPPPHEVQAWPDFEKIVAAVRKISAAAYICVIDDVIVVIPSGHKRQFVELLRCDPVATPQFEPASTLQTLQDLQLWEPATPLRLHLGCGEQHFNGYVNIDYPMSAHNVMAVKPDLEADVTTLQFPEGSVDEIRLHHVFEHFNRTVAIAQLIKWHGWLRPSGKLWIETPDFHASTVDFLGSTALSHRLRAIRHLEGDQSSSWGYHIGQWFPDRFTETLEQLRFSDVEIRQEASGHTPPLFNVVATAIKMRTATMEEQYLSGCRLLRRFMVSEAEQPTFEVWTRQLADALHGTGVHGSNLVCPAFIENIEENEATAGRTNGFAVEPPDIGRAAVPVTPTPDGSPTAEAQSVYRRVRSQVARFDRDLLGGRLRAVRRKIRGLPLVDGPPAPPPMLGSRSGIESMLEAMESRSTSDLGRAQGFNAQTRDEWVKAKAATVASGSRVLDVGAGTAPYRELFAHCEYRTHDFAAYEGYQHGWEGTYADIDIVSDILAIPVADASFDVILCTEVLEHVPRPVEALAEMARIVRRGGRLLVTAPLGSGLHQQPYHYYGGFTNHWYKRFLDEFGCKAIDITPNHGWFAFLAQECSRFSWTFDKHKHLHGEIGSHLSSLLGDTLARYLYAQDNRVFMPEFTVGYHVEAVRL